MITALSAGIAKIYFPSDETGDTLYTYDEAGNVSGITYPDGGVISYKYDKNNNLISVKDATGKETRYSYDALDRVTLTERPNNINTSFAYDGEGHVVRLVNYDSFTGLTISCYAYTYDASGFITEERASEYLTEMPFMTADPLTGGSLLMPYGWGRMNRSLADSLKLKNGGMLPVVTKNTRYTYDEDGKLVRAVEDGWRKAGIEYIYEYDAKGNRTYYEKREAGIAAEKVESTYDKADRLISAIETSISDSGKATQKTWSYTYDGDGNLISEECDDGTVREEAFTYVYEAEDRLKAVYDPEGLVAAYTYDGDGNRVLELSYDTELKGNLNNKDFTTVNAAEAALEEYLGDEERGLYEITRYINDVNREYTQVLMERDGSGALSTAYVYGNERLSVRSTKKESGYYLYDGRGSVIGIVSILGERLESYSYDPSGQAMRATSTNRYQKTFYGYNAESYDPKTGSAYLRARYYNTRTGSFSTKDTYLGDLMEPLSLNRYSYTWGNPVNYQDPSGHGPLGSDGSAAANLGLDAAANQAQLASAVDFCGENGAYVAGVLVELTLFVNTLGQAHVISEALWDYVFGLTPYAAYYYQGKHDVDKLMEVLLKESSELAEAGSDIFSGPYWQAVFAAVGAIGGGAAEAYGFAGGAAVGEGVGVAIGAVTGVAVDWLVEGIAELSASGLLMLSKKAGERADNNQKKAEENRKDSGNSSTSPDYINNNEVPKDEDTFLNSSDYKRTSSTYKGARVYTKDGKYYYRDTFHAGESAHVEVFNKAGKHLGEADPITGIIREGTADASKIFKLR